MQHSEDNEIKIAAYFDGKMSAAEEEAFMSELGGNAALREQYEDELLMRGLFATYEDEMITDDDILLNHQNHNAGFQTVSLDEKKKPALLKLFSTGNFKNIAAALLAVISITIIFMLVQKKRKPVTIAEKSVANKTDSSKIDTAVSGNPGPTQQPMPAEKVFTTYYKKYSGKNDPVEISHYYNDYKNGGYARVISAKDADYQTMGVNDRNALLKQYMHLYKGLSYLEQDNPGHAIQQFDFILQSKDKTAPHYYEAQWYNMLAWLKKKEIARTEEIANLIKQSFSPYKNKAARLSEELKTAKGNSP